MTIRILLVDVHTAVRKRLRTFLSYNADLEVVCEASDNGEGCGPSLRHLDAR